MRDQLSWKTLAAVEHVHVVWPVDQLQEVDFHFTCSSCRTTWKSTLGFSLIADVNQLYSVS
jgi:hypothetical protein